MYKYYVKNDDGEFYKETLLGHKWVKTAAEATIFDQETAIYIAKNRGAYIAPII